jgi:hypothetical protein
MFGIKIEGIGYGLCSPKLDCERIPFNPLTDSLVHSDGLLGAERPLEIGSLLRRMRQPTVEKIERWHKWSKLVANAIGNWVFLNYWENTSLVLIEFWIFSGLQFGPESRFHIQDAFQSRFCYCTWEMKSCQESHLFAPEPASSWLAENPCCDNVVESINSQPGKKMGCEEINHFHIFALLSSGFYHLKFANGLLNNRQCFAGLALSALQTEENDLSGSRIQ